MLVLMLKGTQNVDGPSNMFKNDSATMLPLQCNFIVIVYIFSRHTHTLREKRLTADILWFLLLSPIIWRNFRFSAVKELEEDSVIELIFVYWFQSEFYEYMKWKIGVCWLRMSWMVYVDNLKNQHIFRIPEKGAENPSLLVVQPLPSNVNKWAGEDEDDVKVYKKKLNLYLHKCWLCNLCYQYAKKISLSTFCVCDSCKSVVG